MGILAQTTTCSSQPIFCSDGTEDGGTYVHPDPNNSCRTVCPGQSLGTLSCNITQQVLNQTGGGYNYQLTGNPAGYSQYQWDFTNDGAFDNSSQSVTQAFYANTTVRLQVSNGSQIGTCYSNISLPASGITGGGTCATVTNTESRCVNERICTFNVIHNASFCGSRSENGPYNCTNSTECGFNQCTPGTISTSPRCVGTQMCQFDTIRRSDCSTFEGGAYSCTNSTQCGAGTACRSLSCSPLSAGCSYSGALTYSCDPNAILTCGVLVGSCSVSGTSTVVSSGAGITITNNNTNNNSNNNTIRID